MGWRMSWAQSTRVPEMRQRQFQRCFIAGGSLASKRVRVGGGGGGGI